ncbi:MAG: hypothetical protein U1F43_13115 [Myxococcota bacterium]
MKCFHSVVSRAFHSAKSVVSVASLPTPTTFRSWATLALAQVTAS